MLVYRAVPDTGITQHHIKYTEQNLRDKKRAEVGSYCSQEPTVLISSPLPFSNVRLGA